MSYIVGKNPFNLLRLERDTTQAKSPSWNSPGFTELNWKDYIIVLALAKVI